MPHLIQHNLDLESTRVPIEEWGWHNIISFGAPARLPSCNSRFAKAEILFSPVLSYYVSKLHNIFRQPQILSLLHQSRYELLYCPLRCFRSLAAELSSNRLTLCGGGTSKRKADLFWSPVLLNCPFSCFSPWKQLLKD
jgi:hypothetical protein